MNVPRARFLLAVPPPRPASSQLTSSDHSHRFLLAPLRLLSGDVISSVAAFSTGSAVPFALPRLLSRDVIRAIAACSTGGAVPFALPRLLSRDRTAPPSQVTSLDQSQRFRVAVQY